jgi:DNA-binding transcriptional ArsR family regulator
MTELSLVGTHDALARLGLALSDPVRRSVLLRLSEAPAYPAELAELCSTSRSNMSNHLACLRGCGLIVAEREGRRIRYELISADFASALQTLASATLAATCDHQ